MGSRLVTLAAAADADALSQDLARIYAASIGVAYPIAPQSYGAGRQPEPRESAYMRHYVRPNGATLTAPDEVDVLDLSTLTPGVQLQLKPSSPAALPPIHAAPAVLGLNSSFDTLPDALIDFAVSLGVKWLRIGGPEWSSKPHPNEAAYNLDVQNAGASGHWPMFAPFMAQLAKAHAAGLKVLCVAAGVPTWVRGTNRTDGGNVTHQAPLPSKRAQWCEYARQLALTGCDAIQIVNEPNLAAQYAFGPDHPRVAFPDERVDDYVVLLRQAYARLKSDPQTSQCTVLTCSLAPIGHEQLQSATGINHVVWAQRMFSAKADDRATPVSAAGAFDAFAHHPYANMGAGYSPLDWTHRWVNQPGDAAYTHGVASLQRLIEILQANGQGDKKIWATEFGAVCDLTLVNPQVPYLSGAEQARWLREYIRAFTTSDPTGFLPPLSVACFGARMGPVFFYQWQDGPGAPGHDVRENFMGLRNSDGTEKPAAQALRGIASPQAAKKALAKPAASPKR